MSGQNPYSIPKAIEGPSIDGQPQASGRLWVAYGVASLIAPLLAAIAVFVIAFVYQSTHSGDVEANPMAMVFAPIVLLIVGIPASYAVAGLVGMPIAFILRSRNRLNALTVHGSALAFSALVAIGLPIGGMVVAWSQGEPLPNFGEFLLAPLIIFARVAPFLLLSATAFWFIGVRVR